MFLQRVLLLPSSSSFVPRLTQQAARRQYPAVASTAATWSPFRAFSSDSTTLYAHKALNDRLERCKTSRELEAIISKFPTQDFSGTNYVTAISLLGKLGSRNEKVINRMLDEAGEVEIEPELLGELCFGIGWGELADEIPEYVVEQLITDCAKISTSDLASILMSFAVIEHKDLQLCARLAEEILGRDVTKFECNELALVLKSFSALDYYDSTLCERIATEVASRGLQTFKEDELAMILHSFALFDYRNQPLLEEFSKHVMARPTEDFTVSDFALILSGFAKLKHFDMQVCEKFADMVLHTELEEFETDELQLILHTFAEFQYKDLPLIHLFGEEFCSRDLVLLEADDFAYILQSFYDLGYPDKIVAMVFAKYVLKRNSKELYGSDMASILQYFAWLELHDIKLCAKFLGAIADRPTLEDFETKDICVVLASLVKLKHRVPRPVCDKFAREAQKRIATFTLEDAQSLQASFQALEYINFALDEALQKVVEKHAVTKPPAGAAAVEPTNV